jgi:hypothetical protein
MMTQNDWDRLQTMIREELARDGKLRVDVDVLSALIGEKLAPVVAGAVAVMQEMRERDRKAAGHRAALERIRLHANIGEPYSADVAREALAGTSEKPADPCRTALERIARECGASPQEATGVLAARIAGEALKQEETT